MIIEEELNFLNKYLNLITQISFRYYTSYGIPKTMLRETVSIVFNEHVAQIIFGNK